MGFLNRHHIARRPVTLISWILLSISAAFCFAAIVVPDWVSLDAGEDFNPSVDQSAPLTYHLGPFLAYRDLSHTDLDFPNEFSETNFTTNPMNIDNHCNWDDSPFGNIPSNPASSPYMGGPSLPLINTYSFQIDSCAAFNAFRGWIILGTLLLWFVWIYASLITFTDQNAASLGKAKLAAGITGEIASLFLLFTWSIFLGWYNSHGTLDWITLNNVAFAGNLNFSLGRSYILEIVAWIFGLLGSTGFLAASTSEASKFKD